jgi:hypothetical protein
LLALGASGYLIGCDKDCPATLQFKYKDVHTEFVEITPIKHSCLMSRARRPWQPIRPTLRRWPAQSFERAILGQPLIERVGD